MEYEAKKTKDRGVMPKMLKSLWPEKCTKNEKCDPKMD